MDIYPMPDPKDVFTGELAVPGQWIMANIRGSISWPVHVQKFQYHGRELFIIPVTERLFPGVATRLELGEDPRAARRTISNFLSAVCWVDRQSVSVAHWTGAGRGAQPMGTATPHMHRYSRFDLSYLPEPQDDDGRLALALFREGRGLNHSGYAFLSYYRIVERKFPKPSACMAWINATLDKLTDFQVPKIISDLRGKHPDVANYFYGSIRCAIAHGKRDPVIDPDDPEVSWRLDAELPLMRALAEHCIETMYNIDTRSKVYNEHLYELAGFKSLLGDDLVGRIIASDQSFLGVMVDIPHLRIELLNHDPYPALQKMEAIALDYWPEGIGICLQSEDRRVAMQFLLDFENERLLFNIHNDIAVGFDGTADGAQIVADVIKFTYHYESNGSLRIINDETGQLISRKEAYIPVNYFVNPDGFRERIEHWEGKAEELRKVEAATK